MFKDGTPSGGRPPGRLNDKTLQVQAFCKSVCEDQIYRDSILQRARTNNLGSMEPVIWAYAWGKPKENVDLRVGRIDENLDDLSMEELTARAQDLVQQLKDAEELRLALPAEVVPEPTVAVLPPTTARPSVVPAAAQVYDDSESGVRRI